MSDFLERLVSPGLAAPLAVRPLVPSRFESPVDSGFRPALADLEVRSEEVDGDSAAAVSPTQSFPGFGQQIASFNREPVVAGLEASRSEQPVLSTVDSEVAGRIVAPAIETPREVGHRAPQQASISLGNNEWIERRLDDFAMQLQKLSVAPASQQGERRPPTLHSPSDAPKLNQTPSLNPVVDERSWDADSKAVHPVHEPVSKPDLQVLPFVNRHAADESKSTSSKEPLGREWSGSQDNRSPSVQPPKLVPEELPPGRGQSERTINVTIGRVEVKAIRESAPAPQTSRPQPRAAVMSLEEYLKRRAGGGL